VVEPEPPTGRHRQLFERLPDPMLELASDGRIVAVNAMLARLVGESAARLVGASYELIVHPDHHQRLAEELAAALAGEPGTRELRLRTHDGEIRQVELTLIPLAHDDLATTVFGLVHDVTRQREAELGLERSEALRRLAGRLARVGGWSVDADGDRVSWTDEVFQILEAPGGDEPQLDDILARYPSDDAARLVAALRACLDEGVPFDLELDVDTFAGRRIPVRAIGEAERDDDGTVVRATGAFQDISEQQAASEATEQLAERLRTTFESMTDALFVVDRDWRFTFLNSRAEALLQRSRRELIGRVVWEEFPAAVDSEVYHAYHRALETQTTQVVDEYRYAPLETWFEVNAYPSEDSLAVYFRDVGEQRAARLALEEREAALASHAAMLDEATDAISVRGLDGRIRYWSRGAEVLYGWRADEVIGADARDLVHADPVRFDTAMDDLLRTGRWSGELIHRTRDGDLRTVESRWTLVRDADGEPDAVLAINTDVTEARRTEQQFLRAQRLESLGTLAGGIAHDLNNVLSPIMLAVDLLRTHGLPDEQVALLDTIASGARRGADLVGQVLSFARGVEGEQVEVDLGTILDDLASIVRDTFPKDIDVELALADELPTVLCDSTQIQQVLLNLVVNARDAMPGGGALMIRADTVDLDAQYVTTIPDAQPGLYARIEVEDTGVGMTPAVRERVFEPFFTTKPHGAGTGLGLSTAAAIVRSHGGFVQVYSEANRGSRFRVYLPAAEAARPTAPTRPMDPDVPRGTGETVLVVDDETAVRMMTRQTLEAYGYRVLEATDGAEAVSSYVANRDHVDVVIVDMMMPVMDGPATIHALQRLDPQVRIVGCSGLHADGRVAQAAAAGVRVFLPKPYTATRLLAVVRDMLDGSP
jgi:two-component system, cell cycle sensor histidine kinase and response regulator CckA